MAPKKQEEAIPYNDVVFFLVFIPFINALNYYLTYTNITFNAYGLFTFLIDTLMGYASWFCFRWVILYLDKNTPYETGVAKRIILQILLTSAAGITVIIALTEMTNLLAGRQSIPVSFYQYDLFIFLIWFFVVNGIYIALYYYHALRRSESNREEEKKIKIEGFSVKDGRQTMVLSFDTILVFFADEDYTAVITLAEKRFLIDKSLDKVEQSVPRELFFRLNRQYLVHRNIIQGFTKIENGKLIVNLSSSEYVPAQVQVSRTKASGFKSWFHPI